MNHTSFRFTVSGAVVWKIFRRLVPLLALAEAGLLVFCFLDMNHDVKGFKTPEAVRDFINAAEPGDLRVSITVQHYRSIWGGSPETFRMLRIEDHRPGKKALYFASVDDASLALLAQKGIDFPTYIQGRDFEVLGTPG